MKRLQDRVAIITGGASGIGFATARRFLQEGAKVAIIDIRQEEGEAALQQLQTAGDVQFFVADVRHTQEIETMVAQVHEHYGRIDILINNAGITADATLAKMSDEAWQRVIDINLTGVFACTRAVIPHMIEQGYGRILSTSSVVGLYGNFGQTNYAATKAGVIAMTKTWAKELGRKGITANAVAPGFIRTAMTEKMPEKVLTMMKERVPLQRLGEVEDIANAFVYLASEEASYVNGAVLSVDGGVNL
ncbi:3-oxoacyl-[acyl-carrier-protein] reductase [Rubeoparvulum massiliense]|uniref:3-oxoacyl-[acyl-carrier-protein] reductase n=1 Tax=Rubeoparvulum massiliense TaxID=1631346 RepID=UPI00065E74A2|nr:3-oxoacyl-[acyl-carrier-protein] reductase [Rubeoparvulum massiliense]